MGIEYFLTVFWFFFFCLTFGCIVGGTEPKKFIRPTKAYAFKAWILSVFWPVTYSWWVLSELNWSWLGVRK